MTNRFSVPVQIKHLWTHLPPQRKKQLASLAVLMLIVSFLEVVSIGAVLPFLGALTSPERIFADENLRPIIEFFKIGSAQSLLLPLTLVFTAAVLLAGIARIVLVRAQTRLSMGIGADLSMQVYERTLYQPYALHISRNSSELLAGTQKALGLVSTIIQPTLTFLSSIVILLSLVATLCFIQPVITLVAFVGFGLIYAASVVVTRHHISRNSQIIAYQQGRVTKAIQEGLGGIRDVLIDGSQPAYSKLYKNALLPMQTASASNQVVSASPRYGVEALGMALIAGLAFMLAASGAAGESAGTIPVLGAFALGAQRLLPVLQQIYSAYINIKGNRVSAQDALDLLDQPMPSHASGQRVGSIAFQTAITLKDLGFRYSPGGPWVLRHLELRIPRGCRVGFIGITGSGKSTLLDILLGLLTPTEGKFLIDDTPVGPQNIRAWQAHISQVPQAIYLADTTIAENIAFGVPVELIDLQRVKQAAQKALIAPTIEGWNDGYYTLVGERGVRLSGGQRQRIGIARALYKRADVFFFDEATSALDNDTESAVMQSVDTLGRDVTIFIVAHRLTTLKNCDFIVEVADGGIKALRGYEEMMRRTA